jgi:hypothetical protein
MCNLYFFEDPVSEELKFYPNGGAASIDAKHILDRSEHESIVIFKLKESLRLNQATLIDLLNGGIEDHTHVRVREIRK